jgi:hypothetical protein
MRLNFQSRYIFLIFIIHLLAVSTYGQKGWELGGWLGASHYFGDLNTDLRIDKPGLAGGLIARYNFDGRLSSRFSFNYGRVSADDANSENNFERNRNLSFHSHILDFTSALEFNFLQYEHGSRENNYTPYVFGGFSVFYFNPTARLDGQNVALRPLGTEGQAVGEEYGSINGGIAIGAGFKWDLTHELSMNIEISTRFLFTDYLDDVSTTYPDADILSARRGAVAASLSDRSLVPGIAAPGRQRGNSKDNDSYSFIGISLLRYFGSIPCPKISRIGY